MELAEACAADGIRVVPVPGACAAVAAISVAGFSSHEFVFFGFVSGKRGSAMRRRKLTEIAEVCCGVQQLDGTVVLVVRLDNAAVGLSGWHGMQSCTPLHKMIYEYDSIHKRTKVKMDQVGPSRSVS